MESKYYTSAALWHTRKVVQSGDYWFQVREFEKPLMGQWANPAINMLISMPMTEGVPIGQSTATIPSSKLHGEKKAASKKQQDEFSELSRRFAALYEIFRYDPGAAERNG